MSSGGYELMLGFDLDDLVEDPTKVEDFDPDDAPFDRSENNDIFGVILWTVFNSDTCEELHKASWDLAHQTIARLISENKLKPRNGCSPKLYALRFWD